MALITGMAAHGAAAAEDNLLLHGALVEEPCVLKPGDEDIRLDFGGIIDKYLYRYGRTQAKPFNLTLQDCDVSLGKTVTISFRGTESKALPGLLALNGDSRTSGIALGIETVAGKPIPLNKSGRGYVLVNGDNSLQLQVYIQAEAEAIAKKTIEPGEFAAVATFGLQYE
ncbi:MULTISPECIES: fimbrial protein [Serratia]|uniref:fimbrial protein n=1 Tax=Serratia TaxID=613 RepID=UPI0020A54BD0|nr:fimbrial protein [Serratia marcescens]